MKLGSEEEKKFQKLVSSNNVVLFNSFVFFRRKRYILSIYLRKVNVYLIFFYVVSRENKFEAGRSRQSRKLK